MTLYTLRHHMPKNPKGAQIWQLNEENLRFYKTFMGTCIVHKYLKSYWHGVKKE